MSDKHCKPLDEEAATLNKTALSLIGKIINKHTTAILEEFRDYTETRSITVAHVPESVKLEIVGEWLLEYRDRMQFVPEAVKRELQAEALALMGATRVRGISEFCNVYNKAMQDVQKQAAKLRNPTE